MAKMGCASCSGRKMKTGGQTIVGMPGYNATIRPMQMKEGGAANSKKFAVKSGCPSGLVRMPDGGCGTRETPSFKKGGSTFGMLSVKAGIDKNPKPTAADRIAGAKKNKKK